MNRFTCLLLINALFLIGCAKTNPEGLIASSFVDGGKAETVRDVAIDAAGNVYVTGGTNSTDFPTTPGVIDSTFDSSGTQGGSHGLMDIFITKYDPDGALVWSTYLGGPNYDRAYAIEVDDSGSVYVGGRAGPGFPTTAGALQETFQGDNRVNSGYGPQDGFVAKISNEGQTLEWATYVGGAGRGFIRDLDVDAAGNVIVGLSSNSALPAELITADAAQSALPVNGVGAAIIKLNSDGRSVAYGSYLGGNATSIDYGQNPSVRVDLNDDFYIMYMDNANNSPTTPNAFMENNAGGNDIAIAKFSGADHSLIFCSYLGGSNNEGLETHNLEIDYNGNIIVSGGTQSSNFPTTAGTFLTSKSGTSWASFISKLSSDGQQLLSSTYFTGNNGAGLEGISVDLLGDIYFSGPTRSTNLPTTTSAISQTIKGSRDGYVAKISSDLTQILYLSYFGSNGDDQIRTSALSLDQRLVIGGHNEMAAGFPLVKAHDEVVNGNVGGSFKTNSGFYGVIQF